MCPRDSLNNIAIAFGCSPKLDGKTYCCDSGHRTWENPPRIKLEALMEFQGARGAVYAAEGEESQFCTATSPVSYNSS